MNKQRKNQIYCEVLCVYTLYYDIIMQLQHTAVCPFETSRRSGRNAFEMNYTFFFVSCNQVTFRGLEAKFYANPARTLLTVDRRRAKVILRRRVRYNTNNNFLDVNI